MTAGPLAPGLPSSRGHRCIIGPPLRLAARECLVRCAEQRPVRGRSAPRARHQVAHRLAEGTVDDTWDLVQAEGRNGLPHAML